MKLVFNNKAVAVVLVFFCISVSGVSADILDGLVSYWPMDEGSGDIVEDIVGGHDGAAQGTIDWTAGIIGPAIDCRDGLGYILVGQHADLMPTEAMTIQIWARIYSHTDWTAIIANAWDTGDDEAGWEIFSWTPNNRMIFAAAVGGPLRWIYMSPGPDRGTWGHYVGTYDGAILKGYINGVLMSYDERSGSINYNPEPLGLLFGAFMDDNELYVADTAIDEVALWNRALSDDEIEWLYNGGNGNALVNTGPKVVVTQTGGSTDITEGGADDSYSIAVDTEPTGDVMVSATPQSDEIDLGAGPGQDIVLTINPGNWLTPQTVSVSVVDDNIYLGNRTVLIVHESQSNEDSRYDKVFVAKVNVNVTDDELPVLTDGLVGYWPLDGDILDYSGYDNHGELFNGASYTGGKLGSAVIFDGEDDWAALDGVADEMAGEQNSMSWSCWVNYTNISEQAIFSVNSGGHGNVVIMEHHGAPIGIYENGYEVYTPAFADGLWHHIAYTRDGSTGYLYADGELSGTHNAGFSLSATDLWSLAQEWDTGTSEHFTGLIDDVAVWNRTLTADEVANIWNGGTGEAIIGDGFVYFTLAGSSLEVVEAGVSDSYTMVLGNEPNSDVEVTATPSDAEIDLGGGAGGSVTLTFTSVNWETPQTVTVNAVDDDVYEGKLPHTSKIYHHAVSGDEDFDGRNYSTVNVNVVDNEETCGDWGYLQSDMNKDCIVDLYDFTRFALLWLETTDTPL